MGRHSNYPIVMAILCLALTGAFLNSRTDGKEAVPKAILNQTFKDVAGWKRVAQTSLELEIATALDLDDYLFSTYSKGTEHVSLYIGYYKSAKKIGASHSPLVCFPGQGWEITPPKTETLETAVGKINLASMVVTKGMHRELLFYWFQANSKTSSGTFRQKINLFFTRIKTSSEDNAFVRISLPVSIQDQQRARSTAIEFIRDFYPSFLNYITNKEL